MISSIGVTSRFFSSDEVFGNHRSGSEESTRLRAATLGHAGQAVRPRPGVRQDCDHPRARRRSLQAHRGRDHPAGRTAPESGTDAKLTLKLLHTCQDTFHVCLRLAKRRNTLVTINRAATSIISGDRVLERTAGVTILLDDKAQMACASVNILLLHARVGDRLASCLWLQLHYA